MALNKHSEECQCTQFAGMQAVNIYLLLPLLCFQVFDLMDKDRGGTLNLEEIKQLMDMLGMKVCMQPCCRDQHASITCTCVATAGFGC
jgi:hypothetical protein